MAAAFLVVFFAGAAARLRGEDLFQLADDGGLDGRRCRPDELTHVLELGQDDLALDSELLGELVHPDLCHCSPVFGPGLGRGPLVRRHAHCCALIACSSPSRPAFGRPPSPETPRSLLEPDRRSSSVEAAGEPEGPRQRPTPFGEVQTGQGGVQVRTSPRLPAGRVEPGDPPRRETLLTSAGRPPAAGRTEAPAADIPHTCGRVVEPTGGQPRSSLPASPVEPADDSADAPPGASDRPVRGPSRPTRVRRCRRGVGPDVDAPAGEPGREPGVLALLADGQGELVVGHDHPGRTAPRRRPR